MIENGMPIAVTRQNIDPNDELLHRVRTPDLVNYKAGILPNVTSICGKIWKPTIPVGKNLREIPSCPGCFPPEKDRFSIAN